MREEPRRTQAPHGHHTGFALPAKPEQHSSNPLGKEPRRTQTPHGHRIISQARRAQQQAAEEGGLPREHRHHMGTAPPAKPEEHSRRPLRKESRRTQAPHGHRTTSQA